MRIYFCYMMANMAGPFLQHNYHPEPTCFLLSEVWCTVSFFELGMDVSRFMPTTYVHIAAGWYLHSKRVQSIVRLVIAIPFVRVNSHGDDLTVGRTLQA